MVDYPISVKDAVLKLRTAPVDDLPALISRYANDPRQGVRKAVEAADKRYREYRAEYERTEELYRFQWEIAGDGVVVGMDEVGRGAIAGPLTVACVQLPREPIIVGLNDSKQLTPAMREDLARQIRQHALAIGIAHVPPEDIDVFGMSRALRRAMLEALEDSGVEPDAVLIDGNDLHLHPKERCIVKGDGRVAAIAAASIIAKVTRDAIMSLAEADYPGYGFATSKGYASPEHIAAIQEKGMTEFHRVSFCGNIVNQQLGLF